MCEVILFTEWSFSVNKWSLFNGLFVYSDAVDACSLTWELESWTKLLKFGILFELSLIIYGGYTKELYSF